MYDRSPGAISIFLWSVEILAPLAPHRVNWCLFLDRHAEQYVVLAWGGQADTAELSKSISLLLWDNAWLWRTPSLVSSQVWRLGSIIFDYIVIWGHPGMHETSEQNDTTNLPRPKGPTERITQGVCWKQPPPSACLLFTTCPCLASGKSNKSRGVNI